MPHDVTQPPLTVSREHKRTFHGDTVNDPYEWLRDKDNPEVIAWLEAQNEYAEARTAHLEPLRQQLFDEIKGRTQETDMSVPIRRRTWWYYARTREGQQYAIHCRVPVIDKHARPDLAADVTIPGELVLLDGNAVAGDSEYFSLGALAISPSDELLAYSVDFTGDERYDLAIKDLATDEIIDDSVQGISSGIVWSACSQYLWYARVDDAWRPHEVWRHKVGTPASEDVLIFTETDDRFWMGIGRSRDEQFLTIHVSAKTCDEVHLLRLDDPLGTPHAVAERREGVEYSISSAGDQLLVVHNTTNPNFDIAVAPLDCTSHTQWREWMKAADDERIVDIDAFTRHAVITLRRNGLTALRVASRSTTNPLGFGLVRDLEFDDEIYTVGLSSNPEYETTSVLLSYQTMITPPTVLERHLLTDETVTVKTQPVLGNFDSHAYRQYRSWATASDGTKIPVSIVARADVSPTGNNPGVLYGYGAYEISVDPSFSIARLSLLDRGVVFAIAHVRGGGEMGRHWYLNGKFEKKRNSFSDFVSAADHLVVNGWMHPHRIAAVGGSAGGLLVGAAVNLAPERFRAVLAAVPFVDALTTMLDASLPLTVPEWEEWGNPEADRAIYQVMKQYSPYENVGPHQYPAVLATTSLNDTRVMSTEPAKWVARLQALATNGDDRPVLMRTEMVAGHGGKSGRYDSWREYAWEYSFLLDQIGAGTVFPGTTSSSDSDPATTPRGPEPSGTNQQPAA